MKKYFTIATIVVLVSVLFWPRLTKNHIPLSPPEIRVTYNQSKIETIKNEYTWCDKPNGGATHMGDNPLVLTKNLKTVSVKKGEEIKFDFDTSWKQPNKTAVDLVVAGKDGPLYPNLVKQVVNKNSFNAPVENGEYTYSIFGWWEEGRSVTYVFKINVI